MQISNKIFILFIYLINISCINKNEIPKCENYLHKQKIAYEDSLFIIHTVKEYMNADFYIINNLERQYQLKNEQVEISVLNAFYSPDKLKLIVWIIEKIPNVKYKTNLNIDDKICPSNKSDTVWSSFAIIGFRSAIGHPWKLYPFDEIQAVCFDNREKVINIMCNFFFSEMKTRAVYIVNNNPNYGGKILEQPHNDEYLEEMTKFFLKQYGYNIQDKDFWGKSIIWQQGARIPGLYNFQTKGNVTPEDKDVELIPPIINYPDSIRTLYYWQVPQK